jgi:hypothetical protein
MMVEPRSGPHQALASRRPKDQRATMHSDAPHALPALLRPLLALAALALVGCENVPPFTERSYVRASAQTLVENFDADGDKANGPYPGLGVSMGTLLEIAKTHASALEAEIQAYDVNSGDLDGYGFRYFAGWRRFWNMDGRWRPNMGAGGEWTDFHLDDHDRSFDPNGPGGYFDLGVDWMVTPIYAIGLRLRGHLRYEEADHDQGMKVGVELGLQTAWRF